MTAAATYSIQAAFSGQLTGVFVIGTSTIGGTDVIGGTFGNNAFDDLSAEVQDVDIQRGRSSDLAVIEQGICRLTLNDSNGKYNPENSGSALAGLLVPMRPVRVRATYEGTTYGMFYGFISRIEHDPGSQKSTIEAVDLFEWLTKAMPTIATQTNQTVGYIIGLILDEIGWTDPAMRSLAAGDTIPSWTADGTVAGLTLIQNLLTTDMGMFFIDGDGIATYLARNTRYANGVAVGALTGSLIGGLKSNIEAQSIVNGQTVTRTGGVAQTATDATSRTNYGYRDGAAISSANLASDGQALSLAQFLVAMQKDPRSPARTVQLVNSADAQMQQIMNREMADLVTVSEAQGNTSFTGRIQAMRHRIAGKSHRVDYAVQKVTASVFIIGTSTIGGSDVIAY